MKINAIYVLIFFFVFVFKYSHAGTTDSFYKITRIKTKGDYFIIHAERNDSLFKIISKKTQEKESDLELLKKGNYYDFDFGNNDKNNAGNGAETLDGVVNYLDIDNKAAFVDGKTRIKFTKRFHYRLYTTKNLIGIHYIPNAPK